MKSFARLGVTGLGGCCGTTPEHIFEMRNQLDVTPQKRKKVNICAVCSPSKVLEIGGCHVIGERINPTGKKAFQAALKNNDIDYILNQGIEQADAGADILDVNVGLPDIDEVNVSKKVICELQAILDLPLQIDSSNPLVIEESLRAYTGKAIVNSVNGEQKVLDSILPLVKKYGAMAVALTLDENGIPKSAADRFNIAEKIINEAAKYGIEKENIIVDCLTLTVSAQQEDAAETLKALKMVKEKLGVKTVLGVSNISFGLPRRDIINEVFLAQALACGLDLAIINPNAGGMMKAVFAHRVLANIDKGAAAYIDKFALNPAESNMAEVTNLNLADIIMKGLKDKAKDATRLLQREKTELEIVNDYIIPALDRVGERYDKGIIFLPQLISSAETVKNSFEVLKESLLNQGGEINKGTIILATVKGDIHDIGKNIVKVILENYGYRIVDLGRDVPIETVVAETLKHKAKLVGLSALMTTTVKSMADTIKALKDTCPDTKVFVGGAVLTGEYAKQIGADYYGKDAKQAVEIAKRVLG
jgi:5-methyltetrahydrofolate--homocysteine methyltransferase